MDYNEGFVEALKIVDETLELSDEQRQKVSDKLSESILEMWVSTEEMEMDESKDEEQESEEEPKPQEMEQVMKEEKSVQVLDDFIIVRDYIVRWGNEKKKDLEGIVTRRKNPDGSVGEYFTPETDFSSEQVQKGFLPIDWLHRGDKDPNFPKDDILGYVDLKSASVDDEGLIVTKILNRRHRFIKAIQQLIEQGLIGSSSEPYQDLVKKDVDGRITRWGLRRDSLTIQPMEHRMMLEFKSALDEESESVLLEYGIISLEGDDVPEAKSIEDEAEKVLPIKDTLMSIMELDEKIENYRK